MRSISTSIAKIRAGISQALQIIRSPKPCHSERNGPNSPSFVFQRTSAAQSEESLFASNRKNARSSKWSGLNVLPVRRAAPLSSTDRFFNECDHTSKSLTAKRRELHFKNKDFCSSGFQA